MNKIIFFPICLILLLFQDYELAQNIEVHNFIGKSSKEVINKYGNPVHKDDSNPAMVCMFYKSNTGSKIFVSDNAGVYQAEANETFSTEKEARSVVDKFISNSVSNGFAIDTVSTSDFRVTKKGIRADLQIAENKLSKSYDVKVKATRTEN